MKRLIIVGLASIFLFLSTLANANDKIISFEVPEKIGLKQSPTISLNVEVSKQRELHIAIQSMTTWEKVAKSRTRIKKSGNFNINIPIENPEPGKYRVDVYLAPRGKTYPDRLAEPIMKTMLIIDAPRFEKPKNLSTEDKIKSVNFPKLVTSNGEVQLIVNYDISEARSINIKLLDSQNWKEHGSIVFPADESGNVKLPITNMLDDFPEGKYAWVVRINTKDGKSELAKQGKHFELKPK